MGAIVLQPQRRIMGAYESFEYTVVAASVAGYATPSIEVEIYIYDYIVGNFAKVGASLFFTPSASNRVDDEMLYVYNFDLSEFYQSYFSNTPEWIKKNDNDTNNLSAIDSSWQFETYINVYTWQASATAPTQLQKNGESLNVSQTILVINAVPEPTIFETIDEFSLYRKTLCPWLTRKPDNTVIGLNEYETASVMSFMVISARFDSYDEDDNLIETAYLLLTDDGVGEYVLRFGVGPGNINETNFTEGSMLITGNVAYYTVIGGIRIEDQDVWQPFTETRTYWVDAVSEASYILHFLGSLGTPERARVVFNQKTSLSMKSTKYAQARARLGDQRSITENRIQTYAEDRFELLFQNLSKDEVEWTKEVAITPLAFLEGTDGEFYPIIIEDRTVSLIDTESPVNEVSLTAKYSNQRISHRI